MLGQVITIYYNPTLDLKEVLPSLVKYEKSGSVLELHFETPYGGLVTLTNQYEVVMIFAIPKRPKALPSIESDVGESTALHGQVAARVSPP